MGSFKLGGMTFGSLFKKPETLLYPFEKKTPYQGQKGHIINDSTACILCGMCQKVCPCHCIVVSKADRTWTIDPFLCIQCGSCVRACPVSCLTMDPTYTPASAEKFSTELVVEAKEKAKKSPEGASGAEGVS